MPKIKQPLSEHPPSELAISEDPGDLLPTAFGELMYFHRHRLGLSQRKVAHTSGLSESYFSELENSKRIAPPHVTALRIARAFNLSGRDESNFVGIAASERAALLEDLHLPLKIRQLMAMLRVVGPRLSDEVLHSMRAKLQEVYV